MYQTGCLVKAYHDLVQHFNTVNRTPVPPPLDCMCTRALPYPNTAAEQGGLLYQQKVYSSCVQVQQTSTHKKYNVKSAVTYFFWKPNKLYNAIRNALCSLIQVTMDLCCSTVILKSSCPSSAL